LSRPTLTAVVAAVVLFIASIGGTTAVGAAESAPVRADAAHRCSSGYTHAVLPWGHKCLRAGQYCKRGQNRHYHRYGYHCKPNGRLRRLSTAAARTSIYSGYSKVGYAQRSGSRWNVYEDYSKVGYLQRSGSRWNVYEGSSKVGYVTRSGSRHNVYEGYSKIGYVSRSGSRQNIYDGSSKVGYAQGGNGGPVGGAALLLGLVG
jgi:hypothetical protein